MRIKYFGTKVLIVLTTMLATPVVWAALAWPEWSSASPAEDVVAIEQPAPQELEVAIRPVIHRVVVVPRYVEVEATPSISQIQPAVSAPPPATPASVPTAPPPTSIPQAAILPSPSPPEPAQQQAQAPASGSNGGHSNPAPASGSSSSSSSNSSAPAPSNSRTRGS